MAVGLSLPGTPPADANTNANDAHPRPPKVDEKPLSLPELLAMLESPKAAERQRAARDLGNHRDKAIVEALPKRFVDPVWAVRREAIRSLGRQGDRTAVFALQGCVTDDRWMTSDDYDDPLTGKRKLCSDPRDGGKADALEALATLDPQHAVWTLNKATMTGLTGTPPDDKWEAAGISPTGLIRAWAVQQIVKFGKMATNQDERNMVRSCLFGKLQDPYPLVRRRAAESLRELGDPTIFGHLIERVADRFWMTKQTCRLTGEKNPSEFSDPVDGGKEAALDALKALAPDHVEAALKQAADSPNPHVAAWAKQKSKAKKGD